MSVVVIFHSEKISLMLTDTQINYGSIFTTYDNKKLKSFKRYGMGWSAATGLVQFDDIVFKKIDETIIESTDTYSNIYKEAMSELSSLEPSFIQYAEKTNIGINWATIRDGELICRTGVLTLNEFTILKNNTFFTLPPSDYAGLETSENFSNKYVGFYELISLDGLFCKMLNIFKEISENSNDVSDICDIGLLVSDGNGVSKFQLRDNIGELIKLNKNGSLVEYFKIIN